MSLVPLRPLFVLLGALAATACSSVPELTFVDLDNLPGDGGTLPDGAPIPDGGFQPDGAPPCSQAEICFDGIDNDCNGLTDCDDPACAAFECVAPAPDGWSFVGFSAETRPDCPGIFPASADLKVIEGAGSHSCQCSCAPVGGSCAGPFTVELGSDPTCDAPTVTRTVAAPQATCTPIPEGDVAVPAAPYAKVVPASQPTSCSPTVANTATTAAAPTDGRACTLPSAGACSRREQVCAPKSTPGLPLCVAKTGAETCPAGFSNRYRAGAAVTDGRTCSACSCGVSCGTVTLFSHQQCNTGGTNSRAILAADGACRTLTDTSFTAQRYQATTTAGCTIATNTTPQGSLSFTEERTICCK
jgi:hypothetical protein